MVSCVCVAAAPFWTWSVHGEKPDANVPLESTFVVVSVSKTQEPLTQLGADAGQTFAQLPQLFGSVCVLAHVPSQLSVVEADAQQAFAAPSPLESVFETSPAEHVDVNVYDTSSYELTPLDEF